MDCMAHSFFFQSCLSALSVTVQCVASYNLLSFTMLKFALKACLPLRGALTQLFPSQLTNLVCLAAPAKKAEPKVEAKGQKKRVKKDKDAPKKPMPPFFCYQKLRRDILKGEKPTADNTQLIKVSLALPSEGA